MKTATILSSVHNIANSQNFNVRLNAVKYLKDRIDDNHKLIQYYENCLNEVREKMLNGSYQLYWHHEATAKHFEQEIRDTRLIIKVQSELLDEYSPVITTS